MSHINTWRKFADGKLLHYFDTINGTICGLKFRPSVKLLRPPTTAKCDYCDVAYMFRRGSKAVRDHGSLRMRWSDSKVAEFKRIYTKTPPQRRADMFLGKSDYGNPRQPNFAGCSTTGTAHGIARQDCRHKCFRSIVVRVCL